MNATRFALKPIEQPSYRFGDVPRAQRDLQGSTLTCLTDREAWQSCMAEMLLVCKEAVRRRRKQAHRNGDVAVVVPRPTATAAAVVSSAKKKKKNESKYVYHPKSPSATSTSSSVRSVKRKSSGSKKKKVKGKRKCSPSQSKKLEERWNIMFQELVRYHEENGHCNVPKVPLTKLGNWVHNHRNCLYRVTPERLAKLDSIGFPWTRRPVVVQPHVEETQDDDNKNGGAVEAEASESAVDGHDASSSSSTTTAPMTEDDAAMDTKPAAASAEALVDETAQEKGDEESPPTATESDKPLKPSEASSTSNEDTAVNADDSSSKEAAASAPAPAHASDAPPPTTVAPHASKPLSLEYMADRLDVDDPMWGYVVRTDDEKKMLQGFITVTTFTNYQKTFQWNSTHARSFRSEEEEDESSDDDSDDGAESSKSSSKAYFDIKNRKVDHDGSLAREMQATVRAGDIWNEGIVWPRVAEIGLLGGLACGRTLVRLVLEQLECCRRSPRSNYDFVVLQATDNSIPFYESLGFVRVGGIQQRENVSDEEQQSPTSSSQQQQNPAANNSSSDEDAVAEPVASDSDGEPNTTATLPTRPVSSKVKQYKVTKAGDTPALIAKKLGVDVYDILFLNQGFYPELAIGSKMRLDTLLLIPDEVVAPPPSPNSTSASKNDRPRWYVAKENETPRMIAKMFDLDCMQLVNANKSRLEGLLSSSRLKAGTKIKISQLDKDPDEQFKPYSHWTFPDDRFEDGEPSYMMALKLDRSKRGKKHPRPVTTSLAIPVTDYDPTAKRESSDIMLDATTPEQKATAYRVAAAGRAHRRRWQSHQDALELSSSSSSSSASASGSNSTTTAAAKNVDVDSASGSDDEDDTPLPSPPKKPPADAYRLFVSEYRNANPDVVAGMRVGEVSRLAGEGFRNLSSRDKRALEMRLFDLKVEFEAATEEYKQQLADVRQRKEQKRLKRLGIDPSSSSAVANAPPPPPTYHSVDLFNKVVKLKPGTKAEGETHYDYWYVLTFIPDLQWVHLAPMVQVGVFGNDKPSAKGRPKWKLVSEDLGEEVDISSSLCIPVTSKSMRRTLDADQEEWDITGKPLHLPLLRRNSMAANSHASSQPVIRRESMTSVSDCSMLATAPVTHARTNSRKRKRTQSIGGQSVASTHSDGSSSVSPRSLVAVMPKSRKLINVTVKVGCAGRPFGWTKKRPKLAFVPSQVTAMATKKEAPSSSKASGRTTNNSTLRKPVSAPLRTQPSRGSSPARATATDHAVHVSKVKRWPGRSRKDDQQRHQREVSSSASVVKSRSGRPPRNSKPAREQHQQQQRTTHLAQVVIPVDSVVVVEARGLLGRYRPGGVARVLQVHGDGSDRKYDVKYVLGGREKNVEARYVSLQERAGSGPLAGNGRTGPKDKDQTPSSKRSSPRVHSTAESSPLVQASSSKAQKQSQSKSKKPTASSKRKSAAVYNDEEMNHSEEENSASSSEQESRRLPTTRSLNSPGRDIRGVKRARPSRAGRYGGSYADVVSSPLLTEAASAAKRPRRHGAFVRGSPRLRGSPRFRDPLQLLI